MDTPTQDVANQAQRQVAGARKGTEQPQVWEEAPSSCLGLTYRRRRGERAGRLHCGVRPCSASACCSAICSRADRPSAELTVCPLSVGRRVGVCAAWGVRQPTEQHILASLRPRPVHTPAPGDSATRSGTSVTRSGSS